MPLVSKAAAISTRPAPIAHVTAATDPPPGAGVRAASRSRNWASVAVRYGSDPTSGSLEEPNRPAVFVDVDVEASRRLAEARHLHDVPAERGQEAGARVRADVAHRDAEAGRRVHEPRVGRQRQVRLGHADRQVAEAVPRVLLDLLPGGGQEVDAVGLVDAGGDLLDLDVDRV